MKTDSLTLEQKILRRNKWNYSVGGIGRDMIYQLIATFLMTYVQYSGLGLSTAQFSAIGIILIFGRVWDAVNDPIMGSIVENTHTRWGKYRPWVLIGGILTSIMILIFFIVRPHFWNNWGYVFFFAMMYLLWEMAFTLNDIPYWSILPALSRTKKQRDQIATMVVVFAAVGAIMANAIIPMVTVGNMVTGYQTIAITFVIIFLACTCLTVFGVKEPQDEMQASPEKVTIKKMFQVIKNNDQLLWASLALMLYSVGSGLLTALGYNFFYIELGYNGSTITIFVGVLFIVNVLVQSTYPLMAKKFSRKQLLGTGFIVLTAGYLMFLLMGYLPIFPVSLISMCIFGALVFGGQAIFYMVIILNMTNSIEYNEYRSGQRNEAVVFSLRPFVAKFSSALQQGIYILVLVMSGIYVLSQNVSTLEEVKNSFDNIVDVQEQETFISNVAARQTILDEYDLTAAEESNIYDALQEVTFEQNEETGMYSMVINTAADSVLKDQTTGTMRLLLRISITIIPIILITGSFYILRKKYFIDEKYYEMINKEIEERKEKEQTPQENPA
ncbi:MAG TPA: glycoside-pentoside-hexuronide (GPH):cation symporter [Bacillota bacterium]|nr:glycoside-pentoside-hexuronide (GPH):cation symporter [Bacillota bacterium]HPF41918.1 glycoside-pentoside-hexuronide (GPH):cation symporter [Bacillota bacterium]HPJ85609.1 glycoside-pentoside-hexuronide (GPH):cation symporter [Bacillota bacterium]HPQ61439.1 glycoside-pentoside-hexuronide (GPH):cation symporter [Bacillota bacterium]HRX91327.1 glycoside-pentoside-hexuronide (GPH):cation symporter [Candidatus Izemoplasmatales bacterium]